MTLLQDVGRGVAAGAVGTGVMTATQLAEMRISGREGSDVPGQVGQRLLGRSGKPSGGLSWGVHVGHGLFGGKVRGLIGTAGLGGPAAAAVHFGVLWGTDVVLYRALGIAPWPWQWSAADLATDVFHKGVYVAVTSAAYDAMND